VGGLVEGDFAGEDIAGDFAVAVGLGHGVHRRGNFNHRGTEAQRTHREEMVKWSDEFLSDGGIVENVFVGRGAFVVFQQIGKLVFASATWTF
jgi:hypothetical protein